MYQTRKFPSAERSQKGWITGSTMHAQVYILVSDGGHTHGA